MIADPHRHYSRHRVADVRCAYEYGQERAAAAMSRPEFFTAGTFKKIRFDRPVACARAVLAGYDGVPHEARVERKAHG